MTHTNRGQILRLKRHRSIGIKWLRPTLLFVVLIWPLYVQTQSIDTQADTSRLSNVAAMQPITSLILLSDQPTPTSVELAPYILTDLMNIPVVQTADEYVNGRFPGRNAPAVMVLTLLARNNPALKDSNGNSIKDRAVEHLRALMNVYNPTFVGGHVSWGNMYFPIALGVARNTPSIWSQFSAAQKFRATLMMKQALYTANIFLNTNSELDDRSVVLVDMNLNGSGSLPNQSASFHAYAIGAYLYFGGTKKMNKELAAYDPATFQEQLGDVGYSDMAALYDNSELLQLYAGEKLSPRVYPDPLGVRKPLNYLNTNSLNDSADGFEHPYFTSEPLPATPPRIFQRWGHEFAVASAPKSNVGPAKNSECDNQDLGLANTSLKLPYESTPSAKGMLYEFNVRSSTSGPHTRSSWDYSSWGMQQYMFMFAAVTMTGYWNLETEIDKEIWQRAKRAVEIYRFIGEHKWVSSSGPPQQICTSDHDDAYWVYGGAHWAQELMDVILFDPHYVPPSRPLVQ